LRIAGDRTDAGAPVRNPQSAIALSCRSVRSPFAGQSFLTLFQARFVLGGLHLRDEPEAPLSPQSQLALLALMQDMVAEGGRFVIATHSPILLAFPDATIYTFDRTPPEQVAFEDLEHVYLTRAFLNDPKSFLRRLT
jgi:predicted ATPase